MIEVYLRLRLDAAVTMLSSVRGSTVYVGAQDIRWRCVTYCETQVRRPIQHGVSDAEFFAAIAGAIQTVREAFADPRRVR